MDLTQIFDELDRLYDKWDQLKDDIFTVDPGCVARIRELQAQLSREQNLQYFDRRQSNEWKSKK